ncbi:MAG TPA: hypothetical protein VJC05_03170 [Candidatus Andersenbacteria bacterium]|nr:hypothetical protein [Candidatus Andersenbacteria bacterium]
MKQLSTVIFTITLLGLPLALWAEHADSRVWNQRLAIPTFEPEPARHTPREITGTYLPPIITSDRTLTAEGSPYLLTTTTRVAPGATLTVNAGTAILTHEFASLTIEGTLRADGTREAPVLFASNEAHPLNQTWAGLQVAAGGRATMSHITLTAASPAISCLPDSIVHIDHATISDSSLGLFATSSSCRLTNSSLQNVYDGIVTIDTNIPMSNTTIWAVRHDIRKITTH